MSTQSDLYLRALDGFTDVVEHVPDGGWDVPTPCPDWSARQLLGHVIDAQQQLTGMLTGRGRPPVTDPAALAGLTGADPVGGWRRSCADTVAVLSAVDPEATVQTPGGPGTVSAVLGMVVIEPLVHAWDLAIATGRPVTLDAEVVQAVLPGVVAAGGQLAATGMYRSALPASADAPAQDRLLAALGRRADPRPSRRPDGRGARARPAT